MTSIWYWIFPPNRKVTPSIRVMDCSKLQKGYFLKLLVNDHSGNSREIRVTLDKLNIEDIIDLYPYHKDRNSLQFYVGIGISTTRETFIPLIFKTFLNS